MSVKDVLAASLLPSAGARWAPDEAEHASSELLSFEEIYDRHVLFVWHALCGLGVPRTALDDAVQDVFVVVHRTLPTFERRSKVTTWLFGIARRVARDHRRRRASSDRTRELTGVEEELQDQRPTPFEAAARSEAVVLLERILDRLDEKQRICFVLMDIEQMTADEVASLLEINVNTVYSRLRLARIEFDRLVMLHGRREKQA
jgi:RNA polymerase sigma-70 factor, ECF subfamily